MTQDNSRPSDEAAAGAPQSSVGPATSRRLGIGKKFVFASGVTVLVLCLAEFVLACIWQPPAASDPFVGFSPSVPLLIDQRQVEASDALVARNIQINPAKLVWFNDQSFPATKPAGTYRIVCLGGSTTFGRPFDDSTSYCGWLRTLLPMIDSTRKWEVINAGGISYASYRIAGVMQEFAAHDVDLFILYTGQNEFLEWRTYGNLVESYEAPRMLATLAAKTRLGQGIQRLVDHYRTADRPSSKDVMPAEVDEILNHSIGPASYRRDPDWYRGVEEHFRINLRRMDQMASDAGARLAVVIPASNLRDCSPFKGEFGDAVDAPTRKRLGDELQNARQLFAEGAFDQTLKTLDAIGQTDRQNADVDFLRGRTLLELGRVEPAAESFQLAIDHDVCPLRATTPIKKIIREFVREQDVLTVDFEAGLSELSVSNLGHSCFGAESFLDHVHPTVDVHREISLSILQTLAAQRIVSKTPSPQQVNDAIEIVTRGIDRQAQGVAFRNLAKVTHWAGKFDEAQRNAKDALRLLPLDLESRFILADCLDKSGQKQAAIEHYTELFEIGNFDRAYQPFGELLASQGHGEASKAYLLQAVFASEGLRKASAYESLGRLHQSLGEDELASECFENAKKLQ